MEGKFLALKKMKHWVELWEVGSVCPLGFSCLAENQARSSLVKVQRWLWVELGGELRLNDFQSVVFTCDFSACLSCRGNYSCITVILKCI